MALINTGVIISHLHPHTWYYENTIAYNPGQHHDILVVGALSLFMQMHVYLGGFAQLLYNPLFLIL